MANDKKIIGTIGNTHYHCPKKPKIWSSALIPESYKSELRDLVRKKCEELQRRPSKSDFNSLQEYQSIFWYFGKLSTLIDDLGFERFPKTRPWLKKDPEYVRKKREENIKRWAKEHPEKRRESVLKAYYKAKIINPQRLIENGKRAWLKKKNNKIKCPTCENKILTDSPRCKHCTMKIRMAPLKRPFYWKKCLDCDKVCCYKAKRCHSCANRLNNLKKEAVSSETIKNKIRVNL